MSYKVYYGDRTTYDSEDGGVLDPRDVQVIVQEHPDVDLYLADFADGSDLYMQWSVAMPSDWNASTVTAVFYWIADSASTNSVVWVMQGRSYADSDAIDQAFGTQQTVTDANNAQNDMNISAATPAITITGAGASELVQFRGGRLGTNGSDNLTATARLVGVMITFTRT